MRIKLRDIAERAHVSTATVSRVLNNHPGVDERTRSTVLEALNQLGYPMLTNQSLQSTVNTTRHIIVTTRGAVKRSGNRQQAETATESNDSHSSFNNFVVDGIEMIMYHHGLHMSIRRVRLEEPSTDDLAHLTQADGVILVGGMVSPEVIDVLERAAIPFVLTAAHLGEREVNCVLGDYLRGAVQAVMTLAQLGHHRIAFVNGPPMTTTSQDKLAGYKLGLCESDLTYDRQLVIAANEFNPHDGYQTTQALLQRTRDFSAILYASDTLAIGGLRALKEAGLEVPGQVSVIGCYDEPIAQFTDPQLSSIHLSWQRVGAVAAQRLLALLDKRDDERLRITLPMSVVLRASTAPAART